MNKPTPPQVEGWEKEFDEKFTYLEDGDLHWDEKWADPSPENIKDFISQLLKREKEEIIKWAEVAEKYISDSNQQAVKEERERMEGVANADVPHSSFFPDDENIIARIEGWILKHPEIDYANLKQSGFLDYLDSLKGDGK